MAGLERMKRPLGRRALIASGPLHDTMTLPIGKSNIVRVVQQRGELALIRAICVGIAWRERMRRSRLRMTEGRFVLQVE